MCDQAEPVHGHEDAVDACKRQPEMNLAERFVQPAAKQFGKPEKQRAKNGECRRDAHDEMEMAGDEIVADGSSGGIVARQENSGKSAGEKKRNETEREKHGGGGVEARMPQVAKTNEHTGFGGEVEGRKQQRKKKPRKT